VWAHSQNDFNPSITPEFYIPATTQDRWGLKSNAPLNALTVILCTKDDRMLGIEGLYGAMRATLKG